MVVRLPQRGTDSSYVSEALSNLPVRARSGGFFSSSRALSSNPFADERGSRLQIILRNFDESTLGLYYSFVIIGFAIASCAAYVLETYDSLDQTAENVFEILFFVVFTVDYMYHVMLAEKTRSYVLSWSGIFDFLSLLPAIELVLPEDFAGAGSLGFLRFLRMLRLTRLLKAERKMHSTYIDSRTLSGQLWMLVLTIFSILFIGSGVVHAVDAAQIDNGTTSPFTGSPLKFHDAMYFLMITITTVGYGDISPVTILSRFSVVLVVAVTFILVPLETSKLLNLIAARRKERRFIAPYQGESAFGHVVVCGSLDGRNMMRFLAEFYHVEHGQSLVKSVLIDTMQPNETLEMLILHPHYRNLIFFTQGNILFPEGAEKARLQEAKAVFCMSDQLASDPALEDRRTVLRAITIRAMLPPRSQVPIFVQVLHPGWYTTRLRRSPLYSVVSMQELRLGLLALSCLSPAAIPFFSNFIRSHAGSSASLSWVGEDEYRHGISYEVYRVALPKRAVGRRFSDIANVAFQEVGIIMFALEYGRVHAFRGGLNAEIAIFPANVAIPPRCHVYVFACDTEDAQGLVDLLADESVPMDTLVENAERVARQAGRASPSPFGGSSGTLVAPETGKKPVTTFVSVSGTRNANANGGSSSPPVAPRIGVVAPGDADPSSDPSADSDNESVSSSGGVHLIAASRVGARPTIGETSDTETSYSDETDGEDTESLASCSTETLDMAAARRAAAVADVGSRGTRGGAGPAGAMGHTPAAAPPDVAGSSGTEGAPGSPARGKGAREGGIAMASAKKPGEEARGGRPPTGAAKVVRPVPTSRRSSQRSDANSSGSGSHDARPLRTVGSSGSIRSAGSNRSETSRGGSDSEHRSSASAGAQRWPSSNGGGSSARSSFVRAGPAGAETVLADPLAKGARAPAKPPGVLVVPDLRLRAPSFTKSPQVGVVQTFSENEASKHQPEGSGDDLLGGAARGRGPQAAPISPRVGTKNRVQRSVSGLSVGDEGDGAHALMDVELKVGHDTIIDRGILMLRNPARLEDRMMPDARHLNDHVIVTGTMPAVFSDFIRPLRAWYLRKFFPIVVVMRKLPDDDWWAAVAQFTDVYVLLGDSTRSDVLLRAGAENAHKLVIMSNPESEDDDDDACLVDNDAIFTALALRSVVTVEIDHVVEIVSESNMRLLRSFDESEGSLSRGGGSAHLEPLFAAGRVYSSSVLDALMSQAFYTPTIISILDLVVLNAGMSGIDSHRGRAEFEGTQSHFVQIDIDSGFVNRPFRFFFWDCLTLGVLPVALYRRAEAKGSPEDYVYTCPAQDARINEGDQALVFVCRDISFKREEDGTVAVQERTLSSGTRLVKRSRHPRKRKSRGKRVLI